MLFGVLRYEDGIEVNDEIVIVIIKGEVVVFGMYDVISIQINFYYILFYFELYIVQNIILIFCNLFIFFQLLFR